VTLLVQKFGGSSVANAEAISKVANIVKQSMELGNDVVVVVSAMQGETDRLTGLANQINANPTSRELDALLATGEQVSAALLSIALNKINVPAKSYNALQLGMLTDSRHRQAKLQSIDTDILQENINNKIISVVTGFQGIDKEKNITTIGRGGSDVTAVAVAAALKADECQIFTDVDGVYTTDPRVVTDARRLPHITFPEMLELASTGAKVLHLRAVEQAIKYSVPVRVLSTFVEGPGTLLTAPNEINGKPQVSGIAFDRNQAKLSILGIPKSLASTSKLLGAISNAAIDIDMMIENAPAEHDEIDLSFTVPLIDFESALNITNAIAKDFTAREVVGNNEIAKISLVGVGMKTHAGVASKMFQTLDKEGIPVHLITSSEIKISAVIDKKYLEQGARSLHQAFALAQKQD
jgi:aspartate kinase